MNRLQISTSSPTSAAEIPSPPLSKTDQKVLELNVSNILAPKPKRPLNQFNYELLSPIKKPVPSLLPSIAEGSSEKTTEDPSPKKSVTFGKKITYKTQTQGLHGIGRDILWWSAEEECSFRSAKDVEVENYMRLNPNTTPFEARTVLYQPQHQSAKVNPNVSYLDVLMGNHLPRF